MTASLKNRSVFHVGTLLFAYGTGHMSSLQSQTDFSIDHLKNITQWISNIYDLNQLLELILETGTRIMRAKASSLLLLDHKTRQLYFKVTTGDKKDEIKNFAIKLGQGIAGHVAETGKPLLIEDVAKDRRWYRSISDQIGFKTRSILCVPMKVQDKVIGAIEFINKIDGDSFHKSDLQLLSVFADLSAVAILNARKFQFVERDNTGLKQTLNLSHDIIGNSRLIEKVIADAEKVAGSTASTLILGESGTGKELLARLIHAASPRKDRHMVALNCAAMTETLLESELFGHEKNAFTGAVEQKIGKLELADESTLFLDEIGEMSPGMQAKLLRALQDGVFYRVGGNTPIAVDIRLIAATNRDIAAGVIKGDFRKDLYYRLNVVELRMPPLRERKEDIPLLARHFADLFKKERADRPIEMPEETIHKMMAYDWPGNIRELRNAIERAVVMGNGRQILPEDLSMIDGEPVHQSIQVGMPLKEAMDDFKQRFIIANLKYTGGNQSKAAVVMGIQRTYLSRLISQYRIGR
jgi:Nif-specific regulatory protein